MLRRNEIMMMMMMMMRVKMENNRRGREKLKRCERKGDRRETQMNKREIKCELQQISG